MALEMRGNIGCDLLSKIDMIGRQTRERLEKQFTFAPIRPNREGESFAQRLGQMLLSAR